MVRVAHNQAADECLEMEKKPGVSLQDLMPIIAGEVGKQAYLDGDVTKGMFAVGQDVGIIHQVKSVREIIDELLEDAASSLDRAMMMRR